jgi:hypothetical protein
MQHPFWRLTLLSEMRGVVSGRVCCQQVESVFMQLAAWFAGTTERPVSTASLGCNTLSLLVSESGRIAQHALSTGCRAA